MERKFVLAVILLALGLPAQGSRADKAVKDLRKAMALAEKGNYRGAHAAYKRISKRYHGTIAGEIASSRAGKTAFIGWSFMEEQGPSSNRVDVAVMGEAFKLEEQNRFDDMAKQVPKIWSKHKVLGEYYTYHNFIRVNLASMDGHIDAYGREYSTILDGKIIGRDAPWVTVNNRRAHEMLGQLPEHDGLAIVFVKAEGTHGTGGSGIGVIPGRAGDVVVHEWGHAFANLGDEYTTFTFNRGAVSTRPNISNKPDPKRVPWAHWIKAKAPGIGVYRGGAGRIKGAWKPVASGCAMEKGQQFCRVCREALVLRIYSLVDPIDKCKPEAHKTADKKTLKLDAKGGVNFEVTIMKPLTHGLEVKWWVLDAQDTPRAAREAAKTRPERGPLTEIDKRPAAKSLASRKAKQLFRFKPERGAKGKFRIVCRVRDNTKVSGQSWPWVLADPRGLLVSERAWWVEVD